MDRKDYRSTPNCKDCNKPRFWVGDTPEEGWMRGYEPFCTCVRYSTAIAMKKDLPASSKISKVIGRNPKQVPFNLEPEKNFITFVRTMLKDIDEHIEPSELNYRDVIRVIQLELNKLDKHQTTTKQRLLS